MSDVDDVQPENGIAAMSRSPSRAIVIPAALATQIGLAHNTHSPLPKAAVDRLSLEIEQGPTFQTMTDEDLATLMLQLEGALVMRGWRPQRSWSKVPQQNVVNSEKPRSQEAG